MFGLDEVHGGNIEGIEGTLGVQPLPLVANYAQATEQAVADVNIGTGGEGVNERGARVCFEHSLEHLFVGDEEENCDNPHPISEGLWDVNDRVEVTAAVASVWNSDKLRNDRGYKCVAGATGGAQEQVDASSLPDEDYLDAMFAPLPKEDGSGTNAGETWIEFLDGIQNASQAQMPPRQRNVTAKITVGGGKAVGIDMSDEDYIDRMFAPLPLADRMELEKARRYKLVADKRTDLDVPKDCPTGAGRAVEAPVTTPLDAIPNTRAQEDHEKSGRVRQAKRTGVATHPGADGTCNRAQPEVQGSSETLLRSERGQGSLCGYGNQATVQSVRIKAGAPGRAKPPTKRKRRSRKKAAGGVQGAGQVRASKRRRTRVEDMDPADVHVCDYEGCGKKFARRYNLTVHKRGHRGEFSFWCNMPHCEKPFMWRSSLNRHLRTHKKKRRVGARKLRGKQLGKKSANAVRSPSAGEVIAGDAPVVVGKCEALHELESVQKLVNTVSLKQAMAALLGRGENRVGKDLNVKLQLEERWSEFEARKVSMAEQFCSSSITMSNTTYSRFCTEIMNMKVGGKSA